MSFQSYGASVNRWSNPFGSTYAAATKGYANPYKTGVSVNLATHVYKYAGGTGLVYNFQTVWGSDGADTIVGDALGDYLFAGAGNDTVLGGAGNDWIQGGSGNNTLDGGGGNNWVDYDYLLGGPELTPTSNVQTLIGSQFYTAGPRQSLLLDLALVTSGWSTATVSATAGSPVLYYQSDLVKNFQNINGGAGNDVLTGNSGNNTLAGNSGDNILDGAGGSDVLLGGTGAASLAAVTASGASGYNLFLMASGGTAIVNGNGDTWGTADPGKKSTISFQDVNPNYSFTVPAAGATPTTVTPYKITTGVVFGGANGVTVSLPQGTNSNPTATSSYTVPTSVTSIGAYAFFRARSLQSITIPNSVNNLGEGAFQGVTSLSSIYFAGNAPTTVGDFAFDGVTATAYRASTATGFGADRSWNGLTLAYWVPAPSAPAAIGNAATPLPTRSPATVPLTAKAATTSTSIATTFTAPGPGIVRQVGTTSSARRSTRAASLTVCTTTKTITKAGKTTISCHLTAAVKKARLRGALTVILTTTFTPKSGAPMVATQTIRLARTVVKSRP